MLRRSSLPSIAFNDSKRNRRHSVPTSPPPLPPRKSSRGYVRVQVADFVTVPDDRLSKPRNALGPVDLAKRPPCYDLRPSATPRTSDSPSSTDHVVEISDRDHIEKLKGIVSSSRDSTSESMEQDSSIEPVHSMTGSLSDTPSAEETANPSEQIDQNSEEVNLGSTTDPSCAQSDPSSETGENSEASSDCADSDRELTEKYDDLREYDDESESEEETDPDLDFDKDMSNTSFIVAAISEQDTAFTTTDFSISSVADTSLSEFPTIASINTTDGGSEVPCSAPLEDDYPSVFVAVESTECLAPKNKTLPSFMKKKIPSPVKYTFRPLHRVPSKIEEGPESNEITTIVPKPKPRQLSKDSTHNFDAASDASSSQHEPLSSKSPSLTAVKKVVDKMDPQAALGIAHMPPLALATVGLFRKKRDSEESIWSRRSSSSSRMKRESDESTQSSNTEYYEDDYTKFIERKYSSPKAQLRLRNPLHLPRMIHADEGLKFSRPGFRRSSSVSVSTSDEEYNPLSVVSPGPSAS